MLGWRGAPAEGCRARGAGALMASLWSCLGWRRRTRVRGCVLLRCPMHRQRQISIGVRIFVMHAIKESSRCKRSGIVLVGLLLGARVSRKAGYDEVAQWGRQNDGRWRTVACRDDPAKIQPRLRQDKWHMPDILSSLVFACLPRGKMSSWRSDARNVGCGRSSSQ